MRVKILISILMVFSILFTIPYFKEVKKENYCGVDEDCVPAQCCRPTSCANKDFKPDCRDIAYTLECKLGTMDCDQGCYASINDECKAIIQ